MGLCLGNFFQYREGKMLEVLTISYYLYLVGITYRGLQKQERKEGVKNELYFRIYVVGITLAREP